MHADAPPPTFRTKASRSGFAAWKKYVEEGEKSRQRAKKPEEWDWPGKSALPAVLNYTPAFDHIEYGRSNGKHLVLYDFVASDLMTRRRAMEEIRSASGVQRDA